MTRSNASSTNAFLEKPLNDPPEEQRQKPMKIPKRLRRLRAAVAAAILSWVVVGFTGGLAPSALAQTEELQQQREAEVERFFEEAHSSLDDALNSFDRQDGLPAENDLRFYDFLSETKESSEKEMNTYLDAAAEALGMSSISDRRTRIAGIRAKMQETREDITVWQRRKISAPKKTYNPLVITRDGYQKKIDAAKDRLVLHEQSIDDEKTALVDELKSIGMELDAENIDVLLESITGDEFVRVSIIFDNAKKFARELEQLTQQSGEDLEAARKYYGVYLMLLRTIDRLQNQFIENVDSVYYPKLDEFAEVARQNIAEAEKGIEAGANEAVLQSNIESNQLTFEATQLYKQSLSEQKYQMRLANLECKKNILTATNTYKTVTLSKNVADLLSTSRRAFDSIANLTVPDLRPFENVKMREAFDRITTELRK